ncbi:hypothetical protein L9F63_004044, partial [Diploptera punctata]
LLSKLNVLTLASVHPKNFIIEHLRRSLLLQLNYFWGLWFEQLELLFPENGVNEFPADY